MSAANHPSLSARLRSGRSFVWQARLGNAILEGNSFGTLFLGLLTVGCVMDMSESRLVPLMRTSDRLEAADIVGRLKAEGIEAVWRVPQSPPLDGLEEAWMGKHYGEILVLDVNLERAREILQENEGTEARSIEEEGS